MPNHGPDAEGRVKCSKCRNRVQQEIAASNGGLCGVCHRRTQSEAEREAAKDARFLAKCREEAAIPIPELDDAQKRSQLSTAIARRDEARIDALLATGTDFMLKPAKYSSRTWLSQAVFEDCSISILSKLLAAGCAVNSHLEKEGTDKSLPLEIAVNKERIDVMKWLLENGANPNLGRPIVGAIHYERSPDVQLEMLTLLLDAGADINQTFDLFGNEDLRFTVLDWAETYEISAEVVEYLKTRGARKQWTTETTIEKKNELKHRRIVR